MKRIIVLIIVCFLFIKTGISQIALEHIYDSAAVQLYMVDLEISGKKYVEVKCKNKNRRINFYNLDHSPWKSINLSNAPLLFHIDPIYDTMFNYSFMPLYISETLFNNDGNVEVLFTTQENYTQNYYSGIYNEQGICLTPLDSMGPFVNITTPAFFRPIYNTTQGTKLIMSHKNGDARVYSLPGIVTSDAQRVSETIAQALYPNPNNGYFKIKQSTNPNSTKQIIVSDINGQEIQNKNYSKNESEFDFDLTNYTKGIYFVKTIEGNEITIKKVIIQ